MKHVFSKPYEFEGKQYKEIDIDLDTLKGSDVSAVKTQFSAAGKFAPVPTTDIDFCVMLAARVAKQPIEFFNDLPAKDYCAVAQGVSNFLLA